MKLGIAQLNLTVGDIAGNTARLLDAAHAAHAAGAALLLTPRCRSAATGRMTWCCEAISLRRAPRPVEQLATDAPPGLA